MMSATGVVASPSLRAPGSVAIAVTIAVAGALGAVGLVRDLSLPAAAAGGFWVAVTLLAWGLYGAVLALLVRGPLRQARVVASAVVLALVWGGLAALDIAARANTAVSTMAVNASGSGEASWTVWLVAPAVEETVKTLGIVLLALLPAARRFGPVAGLAVGALVGVSFQVVENVVYTLQAMLQGSSPAGALLTAMVVRGVVGVFSHVVFSGVIGAAIGWAVAAGPGRAARRVLGVAAVWLSMVALHMWSNWTTTVQAGLLYVVTMGVGLVVLVLVYRRVMRPVRAHRAVSAEA